MEIELNEDEAPFLSGQSSQSMNFSPIRIVKNPDGSLQAIIHHYISPYMTIVSPTVYGVHRWYVLSYMVAIIDPDGSLQATIVLPCMAIIHDISRITSIVG